MGAAKWAEDTMDVVMKLEAVWLAVATWKSFTAEIRNIEHICCVSEIDSVNLIRPCGAMWLVQCTSRHGLFCIVKSPKPQSFIL